MFSDQVCTVFSYLLLTGCCQTFLDMGRMWVPDDTSQKESPELATAKPNHSQVTQFKSCRVSESSLNHCSPTAWQFWKFDVGTPRTKNVKKITTTTLWSASRHAARSQKASWPLPAGFTWLSTVTFAPLSLGYAVAQHGPTISLLSHHMVYQGLPGSTTST